MYRNSLLVKLIVINITTILLVSYKILATANVDEYLDLDPGAARPVPPELQSMFANKSELEVHYEECMVDYVQCMRTTAFRGYQICGKDSFGNAKVFPDLCDLGYENCKDGASWGYFQDDHC